MTYWKDSLLIGVPAIDKEHRELVAAIDNVIDACTKGRGRAAIDNTLKFVGAYTKNHFANEEKLQVQYAYPGMSAHKKMHAQFIVSISALIEEFDKNGPSVALTAAMNKTLVDWLIHHISTEDKKLGDFINGKRA